MAAERRDHRAVVGAQPRTRHPDPDALRGRALLGDDPQPGVRRDATDETLAVRAAQLSKRYLGGHARPTSVRWVSTMGRRWASCTPAEGTIRVSDRLRDVPEHVLYRSHPDLTPADFAGWVQDLSLYMP